MASNIYDLGTIRLQGSRRFDISTAASIRQAAYDYGQRHGMAFKVRVEHTTKGRRYVRVYRVR